MGYFSVVGGSGPNYIIFIAAGAAALLLFLILLAVIFLARRGCQKKKLAQGDGGSHYETPDNDNSFDPPNTGNSFDPPTAITHTNGHIHNGGPPNGHASHNYTPDIIAGNGHIANGHTPNGFENNGYVDHRADVTATRPANGVPIAPVLAAPPPLVARKVQLRKKPPAPPPDPTFELSGGTAAQATMIQRLANRLRKGISSIRWSGHHGGGDHGDGGHHQGGGGGRTAKDMANRKKRNSQHDPSAMVTDGDANGSNHIDDVKQHKKEPRKKIDIPPNTHKMPRGFAPASHCVPITVKNK